VPGFSGCPHDRSRALPRCRGFRTVGRELPWWHTWSERFAPPGKSQLLAGDILQIAPIQGYPDSFSYHADAEAGSWNRSVRSGEPQV
jgi:hypothetical protein